MSELRLAIVKCRYPEIVQDELLKDQYIFGLSIKEIQDHLPGEIVVEDTPEKCLFESCKVESKREQRNLLGIKTSITYDAIKSHRGRSKFQSKSQGRGRSNSTICNCKYCVRPTTKGIAQHMAKSAKNVAVITTPKLSVKVVRITMKAILKEIITNKVQDRKGKKVP